MLCRAQNYIFPQSFMGGLYLVNQYVTLRVCIVFITPITLTDRRI